MNDSCHRPEIPPLIAIPEPLFPSPADRLSMISRDIYTWRAYFAEAISAMTIRVFPLT
jgi:hypothetical protein